jgi:hypothetical protein
MSLGFGNSLLAGCILKWPWLVIPALAVSGGLLYTTICGEAPIAEPQKPPVVVVTPTPQPEVIIPPAPKFEVITPSDVQQVKPTPVPLKPVPPKKKNNG